MGGFQLLRTFTLSHTMAIMEVAVATQLDRAGVDLTKMPAYEQTCAAQLVESSGMSSLQTLALSSVIST